MAKRKAKQEKIWAPKTSQFKGGASGPGPVSFEAYFLRDLFNQGKIDEELLSEIVTQNKLPVDVKDVMSTIKYTSGASIARGLAKHIADIASIISETN